ncbi:MULTISPECIES: glycoside hydrolase family 108 protein [unclassified Bradyrhizobium]|uniref:glycoside hydrolase family 108 protein n=1 Tax=unclassified Bradyrhizobium TaxID=2631580 RepID=UPI0029160ACE|nr:MULTISPECIES: glycosyl hydrolase 108 family protein [unclassified Bradyrhizobium]
MTASNREAAISKTLQYEGGYTNDPRDPGGATNWGITIADARHYWKPDATSADVKAMPKEVAIDIYRQKYWAKIDCDNRPTGPDFVDFDYSVNSGTGHVTKLRAKLDPLCLTPVDYVKRACAERLAFLRSLKTFAYFGKGWSKRVADVEATGVRMATAHAGQPVDQHLQKEADAAAKKAAAHAGGAIGTVVATGTVVAAAPSHHWLGLALLGLGAFLIAAEFLHRALHHNNRATAYTEALNV